MSRRHRLLLTFLLVGALACAPVALAQDDPASEDAADDGASADATPTWVVLDLHLANDTAKVFVLQEWEGEKAKHLRQSLDVYFGAADGTLTPNELDRIAEATQNDMRNQTLPWMTIDGGEAIITDVRVTFTNATGEVARTDPIEMTHEIDLATSAASGTRAVTLEPLWAGELRVATPGDLGVTNAEGFASETQEDDSWTGRLNQGQQASLEVAEVSPEQSTGPGTVSIPSVGIVAGAAALALTALVTRRKR